MPRAPAAREREGGREKGKLENKLNPLTLCLRSRTPDTPPKYSVVFSFFFLNAPRQAEAGILSREQQEGKNPSKSCHFPHNRGVWQTPGTSPQYVLPKRTQGSSRLRAERVRDRP